MAPTAARVLHRRINVGGVNVFYREAGPPDAPVLLLPHGYPSSSYAYRDLLPRLGDRWRLVAPDFPGSGYSDTPAHFRYDFDGYADFLDDFATALGLSRCALWLHDFGSQIGLRFAAAHPERIAALLIQNGDIYEDQLGPGYAPLREFWDDPTPERRAALGDAVTENGFREEFLNDVSAATAEAIPPDLWRLHWSLMTADRREIVIGLIAGLRENLEWFPRYQAYLRENQPPTLILWGPQDRYMPEGAGRAYLRDLPDAEFHVVDDGGHWLLETHLDQVVDLLRDFLGRVHR